MDKITLAYPNLTVEESYEIQKLWEQCALQRGDHKIGWKMGQPCFLRVKLTNKIKNKYINSSARKISNRLKIARWKRKGVVNFDGTELTTNFRAALIQPDGKLDTPAFLVFENYEKILKWNRSLRFGISVCTLANMIKT